MQKHYSQRFGLLRLSSSRFCQFDMICEQTLRRDMPTRQNPLPVPVEQRVPVEQPEPVEQQLQEALKTIEMMEERERQYKSDLEAAKERESMLLTRLQVYRSIADNVDNL